MSGYLRAIDAAALEAAYPIGSPFTDRYGRISRDALRAIQEDRFRDCVALAWKTGFYQRLWGAAGIEPGDIRGLDDLPKLPIFDKADLMASLATHPPYGDAHGLDSYPDDAKPPVILQTTSGTTGDPQVMLFGPWSREVQNLLAARVHKLAGIGRGDVVQSVYGFGMINGGHYAREAFLHWSEAVFLPAGTGAETRSIQQIGLMQRFGVTVLVGFADYIKKLGHVAREQGLDPGKDLKLRLILGHFGREDRAAISELWGGVETWDWYGVADTGCITAEGPEHDGHYVMEDAHWVEVGDIETGRPISAPDQPGDLIVTCLYKRDLYPLIRFNTHDVTAWHPGGVGPAMGFQRCQGILGRSDNMVKLRGINVFAQSLGPLLQRLPGFQGEYICRVERDAAGLDHMTVLIEVTEDAGPDRGALTARYAAHLSESLGVGIAAELHPPGALTPLTGVDTRQKARRLIDNRGIGTG